MDGSNLVSEMLLSRHSEMSRLKRHSEMLLVTISDHNGSIY